MSIVVFRDKSQSQSPSPFFKLLKYLFVFVYVIFSEKNELLIYVSYKYCFTLLYLEVFLK